MLNLYGSARNTLEEVRSTDLVRPERAGRFWKGVPHGQLVDGMMDAMLDRNWRIEDAQFNLAGKGADIIGAFDVSIPGLDPPDGQFYSVGFMSSNRMLYSIRLSVGSTVAVCHNGLITGEIVLNVKHTIELDLTANLNRALDDYTVAAKSVGEVTAKMQNRQIDDEEWNVLALETGRRGLLPWSRIGQMDEMFRNPPHEEHGTHTAWAAMNAFTEVVKKSPARQQLLNTNKFRELLPLDSAV